MRWFYGKADPEGARELGSCQRVYISRLYENAVDNFLQSYLLLFLCALHFPLHSRSGRSWANLVPQAVKTTSFGLFCTTFPGWESNGVALTPSHRWSNQFLGILDAPRLNNCSAHAHYIALFNEDCFRSIPQLFERAVKACDGIHQGGDW